MATAPKVAFDADKRASERTQQAVTIGGKIFFPRKRTVALMENLAIVAPEAFGAKEFDPEKDPVGQLRIVNVQLNELLRNADTGEEPGVPFLNEELDLEDGYRLLDLLSPDATEEAGRVRD